MSLAKLAEKANLANWLFTNKSNIALSPEKCADAYTKIIEELFSKIKEEYIDEEKAALLKKIYSHLNSSMIKSEFYKFIDEFVAGNFENLEILRIFLTIYGKKSIYYSLWSDYYALKSNFEDLRNCPDDEYIVEELNYLMDVTHTSADLCEICDEIRKKNYDGVDKKIKEYEDLMNGIMKYL